MAERSRALPAGLRVAVLCLAVLSVAAACSRREPRLPGEREAVRPVDETVIPLSERDPDAPLPALNLPAPQRNAAFTHLNGDTTHLAPHYALSASPRLAWTRDIGAGDAKRVRLTAAPIVANGAVYTLDAATRVTAVTTGGQVLWQSDLTAEGERANEGFGGGLAYGDGALAVTTGFGEVLRLDPATGAVLWRTKVEGTIRSAPTVSEGMVVVATRADVGFGLDLETGRISWRVQGTGLGAGVIGGSSPAVRGPVSILAFKSGEVSAVLTQNGLTVWSAAVTDGRRELVRAAIKDITGDPVIDFDIVYAASQAGRLVAFDRRSGERIWTHRNGALTPALPVGGSVFIISDLAELLRIDAATGDVIWAQPLPEWDRPNRRRRNAIPHYGPLLAGGNLIVASGDGLLRFYDPATGAERGSVGIPGGATAQPAIADGVLYIVSGNGQLHAFQ